MNGRHEDYCTLLRNGGDEQDILTRRLFDVNMRLFRCNEQYRTMVRNACRYIQRCAMTTREGYKRPHGYSGANAGIPWNIIAMRDGRVMINPRIVEAIGRRESESNCGSLLLERPIRIWRYECVTVKYFATDGAACEVRGYLPTVQHEIDHNNGALITDRRV